MPRKPTEFDLVEHLLQDAAARLRESQLMGLEEEQLRTAVYHHIAEAINIIASHAYVPGNSTEPLSLTSPPEGRRGGGGGAGGRRTTRSKEHMAVPGLNLHLDLDILKDLK